MGVRQSSVGFRTSQNNSSTEIIVCAVFNCLLCPLRLCFFNSTRFSLGREKLSSIRLLRTNELLESEYCLLISYMVHIIRTVSTNIKIKKFKMLEFKLLPLYFLYSYSLGQRKCFVCTWAMFAVL